jgi:hypothetical protein
MPVAVRAARGLHEYIVARQAGKGTAMVVHTGPTDKVLLSARGKESCSFWWGLASLVGGGLRRRTKGVGRGSAGAGLSGVRPRAAAGAKTIVDGGARRPAG